MEFTLSIDENTNNLHIGADVQSAMDSFVDTLMQHKSDFLEEQCRKNCTPKIKCEITKGKLRWRGIVIHEYNEIDKIVYKVMQRGKQLGKCYIQHLF